ncbi:MAG TPA: NAD-dependent epimerase/dehydratase family protein [Pyrinomonadaceae bacterium]
MRILITGSRGFVGGSVGRYAVRAGHEVLGVGRATQADVSWPGVYVSADIVSSDLSGVIHDFAPDVVLHAAGTASVGASLTAPLDDLRAALLTWANTLESVRRSGLRPLLLYASSAAVYGNLTELPVREDAPARPISPYGFHKAACELLAHEYAECYSLPVVVCRLFSLFGATQRRLLVWELYRQFAAGNDELVWLQGTGTETRDYLHIDDVAAALLDIAAAQLEATVEHGMEATKADGASRCLVLNVASGEETSVSELARRIGQLVAPQKEIRCRGLERPGDPRAWRADITRLRTLAPYWHPQPLTASLAQCIAAWQAAAHK